MRVFRVWKFVKAMHKFKNDDKAVESLKYGWPYECDGLTEEEIHKLGYGIEESWMVEED